MAVKLDTADVSLRPTVAADGGFLYRLYAESRSAEIEPLGWDRATRESFLRMQFSAQDRAYRDAHPDASFDVVVVDGRPAGRLYVARGVDELHIIDITLLAQYRGRGIGTGLIRAVLDEARRASMPLTLEVLRFNPAVALYRRLGFEVVGEGDVYLHMASRVAGGPS